MSLQASAGILAATYGFERLTAASGAIGTGLTNFNALTGISVQRLQQYQYAARQVGVSNEEMASSLKSMQSVMGAVARGESNPAGVNFISPFVGGFDRNKIQDIEYVMGKLKQFANNPAIADVQKRWALGTFGLGEGVITGLMRNAFRPDILKRAPTYGDKEIDALNRANIAWSNLGTTIEMAVGHFNAKHGAQLVHDIGNIVTKVEKLADAFLKIADRLKLFEILGKYINDWAQAFDVAAKGIDNFSKSEGLGKASSKLGFLTSDKAEGDISRAALGGAIFSFLTGKSVIKGALGSAASQIAFDYFNTDKRKQMDDFLNKGASKLGIIPPHLLAPSIPATAGGAAPTTNVNVNQNLNFQHDGKDHAKTGGSVKEAIKQFYRQSAAQLQGS